MQKHLLAIDVDECLASYSDAFLPFLASRGTVITREQIVHSFKAMGIGDDVFDAFYETGALATLPVVPGSRDAIQALEPYFHLIAMTSRPMKHLDATEKWITEHFPEIEAVIYTEMKAEACHALRAWGLVDDIVRFGEGVERFYCLANPWNAGYKGMRGDWPTLTDLIIKEVICSNH